MADDAIDAGDIYGDPPDGYYTDDFDRFLAELGDLVTEFRRDRNRLLKKPTKPVNRPGHPLPSAPTLVLTPASLSFSATAGSSSPANQSVTITNGTGVGSLAPALGTPSAAWLSASLAANVVTVSADVTGLSAGTYTGTIAVTDATASNSPQAISATFVVAAAPVPPAIHLASSSLSFSAMTGGSTPAAQTVAITNTGGQTLTTCTPTLSGGGASYFSAAVTGSGNSQTLTVTPASVPGSAGTYTASVSLASTGASNTPQTVSLTFTVTDPTPTIELHPSSIGFSATEGGASPSSRFVEVINISTGTFNSATTSIDYGSGSGWLSVSAPSGSANGQVLTVSADVTGLTAGTYTATIHVDVANAVNTPQDCAVTFVVSAAPSVPVLTLTPTSRAFSVVQGASSPAAQTVAVSNGGGGTLATCTTSIVYTSGASGWLSASVSGSGNSQTVTLTPTTPSLSPGSYAATVHVASAGAAVTPQDVTVTLDVLAPAVGLSATTLAFSATAGGSDPATQNVSVSNSGTGGTLATCGTSIAYTSGSGWLSATQSGSGNAQTIAVAATTGSLAAGTYSATITVTSAGATNTPQTIAVTFTVGAGSGGTTPPPSTAVPPIMALPTGMTYNSATDWVDGSPYDWTEPTYTVTDSAANRSALLTKLSTYANDTRDVKVVLTAGVDYGAVTMPARAVGCGWLTLETSAVASLPACSPVSDPKRYRRVKPSDAANLAIFSATTNAGKALDMTATAKKMRFVGIKFTSGTGVTLVNNLVYVRLDSGMGTLANQAQDIVIDRCLFQQASKSVNLLVGCRFETNGGAIVQSWFDDVTYPGTECKCVSVVDSSGRLAYNNNYFGGGAIGCLTGGGAPSIAGTISSDVLWQYCHFHKLLNHNEQHSSYDGVSIDAKNHLEWKFGRRQLAQGCVFENNWPDAQNGYSIVCKSTNQTGTNEPWVYTADITIRYCAVYNSWGIFSLAGHTEDPTADATHNVDIAHVVGVQGEPATLWSPKSSSEGDVARMNPMEIGGDRPARNIRITRCTFPRIPKVNLYWTSATDMAPFTITNNLFEYTYRFGSFTFYGMKGGGAQTPASPNDGQAILDAYAPGTSWTKNVYYTPSGATALSSAVKNSYNGTANASNVNTIVEGVAESGGMLTSFSATDHPGSNYTVVNTTALTAGTGGTPVGADWATLSSRISGVRL